MVSYGPGPLKPLQVRVERESPRYQYRELLFETLTPRGERSQSLSSSLASSSFMGGAEASYTSSPSTHFASAQESAASPYPSSSAASSPAPSVAHGFRTLNINPPGSITPSPLPSPYHGMVVGKATRGGSSTTASLPSSCTVTPSRCECVLCIGVGERKRKEEGGYVSEGQ